MPACITSLLGFEVITSTFSKKSSDRLSELPLNIAAKNSARLCDNLGVWGHVT